MYCMYLSEVLKRQLNSQTHELFNDFREPLKFSKSGPWVGVLDISNKIKVTKLTNQLKFAKLKWI